MGGVGWEIGNRQAQQAGPREAGIWELKLPEMTRGLIGKEVRIGTP